MTTTEPTTALNPARWAPDPSVRGQLRYWDGTRWTPHTVDPLTASRPALPSWFGSATRWLYAACGLTCSALLLLVLLRVGASAPDDIVEGLTNLAMTGVTALVFLTGAWAYTLAGSREVNRSSLSRDPVWLLVAWFIPIIHVVFPHQLFGEIWASARRVRSGRSGDPTSLTSPRPWVMRAWVVSWALSTGGFLLLWLFGVELATVLVWHLAANALTAALLAGVVRVIAKELPGPSVSLAVS